MCSIPENAPPSHRRASCVQVERQTAAHDGEGDACRSCLNKLDAHYTDLLNQRLGQSQALEVLGALSAGVAHDFNTLLGTIVGHAEMGLDELPEHSPCRQNLQQILAASLRARELIARILLFSAPHQCRRITVDTVPVIQETLSLLNSLLGPGLRLNFSSDLEYAPVSAETGHIQQIVMNLCINAADATDHKGTVEIRLDLTTLGDTPEERKPGVCLSVSDKGSGIHPDLQERIFDPFFTTKDLGMGSGLGLSVVYDTVTQIGGHIELSSTPGDGSTFRIYLPLAVEKENSLKTSTAVDRNLIDFAGEGQ